MYRGAKQSQSHFTVPIVKWRPIPHKMLTMVIAEVFLSFSQYIKSLSPRCTLESSFVTPALPHTHPEEALWPAQAQVWAGPRAAYARCGGVWTPPHRSHPSRAGEGSGSGEWCTGSPKGCGFPGWGFLSSAAAHTASPATVGSVQSIHRAPRNQMWAEGQLDLKLCAESFAGLISHINPTTPSCLLVSTNPWYILFPASWRNWNKQECSAKTSVLPPSYSKWSDIKDINIFPTEKERWHTDASSLPFQSPVISPSK